MDKTINQNYYTNTIEEMHKLISVLESKTELFSNPSPIGALKNEPTSLQGGTKLGLQLQELHQRLENAVHNIA